MNNYEKDYVDCFRSCIFLSACNLTEPNKIEEATVTNRSSITPINFQTNGITYSIPNTQDTSITIRLRWTDAVELLNNPRATVSKYYDYSNGDKMKIKFVDMPVYKFTIKKNSNTDIALKVFMEANNAPTDTYGGTLTAAAHRGNGASFAHNRFCQLIGAARLFKSARIAGKFCRNLFGGHTLAEFCNRF